MRNEYDSIALEIEDAIMERPYGFVVDGKRFYLYPVSLGKSLLLSRLIRMLSLDADRLSVDAPLEILKATAAHKDTACRIIAISTARSKDEAFDTDCMDGRQRHFMKRLTKEETAQLLLLIYQYDKTASFIKYLGLDREQKDQSKISKLKNKKGNTVMFGGKSVYGSLLGVACEKYGWTLEYAVWGISLVNLRMMLADCVNSVYLSDEEKKTARLTNGQEIVSMDNPDNWAKIKAMNWD